jgi:hypothetical protein
MYLKCKKTLYKSTYKGNAFIEGRFYFQLKEDKEFVQMEDETNRAFDFAKENRSVNFYLLEDYFELPVNGI